MSDTYYIRAYHNNKHINVPLEEKHQYILTANSISICKEYPLNEQTPDPVLGNGYEMKNFEVALIYSSNWLDFEHGTDDGDYIGDKIQLKNFDFTTEINFEPEFLQAWYNNNNLSTAGRVHSEFNVLSDSGNLVDMEFNSSNTKPIWLNMRLMCVKFNDTLPGDTGNSPESSTMPSYRQQIEGNIGSWFRQNWIYYDKEDIGPHTVFKQSVHQSKMRESTPQTGTFTILYDKKFKIKDSKPIQMEFFHNFNKNVNIDPNTHKITHDSTKNIYWFLLGPSFNRLDMSPNLSTALPYFTANDSSGITAALETYTNLKVTYYDL